ncbi:XkdX family protein [Clostridium sp. CCUG 7971]|nr:XkdX family protein [Clostridium sp. CCUG 7971]MBO3443422.1 XkdX family protein [Clostridium sp. CCUG 7971]
MWKDTIKKWYEEDLYNNEDVKVFVVAKMITTEEYKEITNEDYIA